MKGGIVNLNTPSKASAASFPPASLAYLGDAVFELLVRSRYISECNAKPGLLHKKTVKVVNSEAQARIADKLLEVLEESEEGVYKRGRNAAVHSMPKNAKIHEYCKATGLEAVFGQLYLDGNTDRINELFEYLMENSEIDQ